MEINPNSKILFDVFISYSRADEGFATRLVDAINKN